MDLSSYTRDELVALLSSLRDLGKVTEHDINHGRMLDIVDWLHQLLCRKVHPEECDYYERRSSEAHRYFISLLEESNIAVEDANDLKDLILRVLTLTQTFSKRFPDAEAILHTIAQSSYVQKLNVAPPPDELGPVELPS